MSPVEYSSLARAADPSAPRATMRELVARTVVGPNAQGGAKSVFTVEDLAEIDAPLVDALVAMVDEIHAEYFTVPSGVSPVIASRAVAAWADHRDRWVERLRARHAPGIVAYFGLPSARHATSWQVLAYAHLLTAEES